MRSEGYCSWVCLSVCLLSHISPLERLFVLKTLSRTQRATKVKKICGVFSETAPLQRSSTPSVDGHTYVQPAIFPAESGTHAHYSIYHVWWWTEAAISSQFLCRAEGGCEIRELPLVMLPSKVCPQCNAVVPIRLKVCRNRLKFALYNADRVNFKSRNYHVVAYNISILAEGLHFSALVYTLSIRSTNDILPSRPCISRRLCRFS